METAESRVLPEAGRAAGVTGSTVLSTLFVLLMVFNIALPKGGFKVGSVPITNGYILLAVCALLGAIRFAFHGRVPLPALLAWAGTVPFSLVVLGTFHAYGSDSGTGYTVSTLANFVIFPTVIYLLFAEPLQRIDRALLARTLVWCIRFAALFGLFQFALKVLTGVYFEVPYLIYNAADIGMLEDKNNMRGELYKLISTYNNGNIYGTCMNMMLPLYYVLEKRKLFLMVVVGAIVLTLSRTSWAGLLFVFAAVGAFSNLELRRKVVLVTLLALAGATLPMLLEAMGKTTEFLFDADLGGRAEKFALLAHAGFLPSAGIGALTEIVYIGIVQRYGYIGLGLFLVFLFAPVVITFATHLRHDPVNRNAALGIAVYSGVAAGDGAILLIPVVLLLLFVSLVAVTEAVLAPARSASPVRAAAGQAWYLLEAIDEAGRRRRFVVRQEDLLAATGPPPVLGRHEERASAAPVG